MVDDSTLDKPYAEKIELLKTAHEQEFQPECVVFDSEYSHLVNLKSTNGWIWIWLTRLKANRLVNLDRSGLRPVARVATDAQGTIMRLKGYGLIRLFKIIAPSGDIEWWASNDLKMGLLTRVRFAGFAWMIDHYHRGINQFCGIERAQRNHIGLALRAFLRLERHCYRAGISWFEVKTAMIRPAVRAHLTHPLYTLPAIA